MFSLTVYIPEMKLTGYGKKEWLGGGVISLLLIAAFIFCTRYNQALFYTLAGLTALVYFCVAAFFRDPKRIVPDAGDILVAPADGVIKDIELLKDAEENQFFEGKDTVRVGIFLSVLNVHLNRAPCDIEVKEKKYREGKYHDARSPLASKENEAMTISCISSVNDRKFPLILRQISGAIAKRIVCIADEGTSFKKGERFGMIKFGSRTELFLPAEPWMELKVKIGDKVYAGETVVAKVISEGKTKDA